MIDLSQQYDAFAMVLYPDQTNLSLKSINIMVQVLSQSDMEHSKAQVYP